MPSLLTPMPAAEQLLFLQDSLFIYHTLDLAQHVLCSSKPQARATISPYTCCDRLSQLEVIWVTKRQRITSLKPQGAVGKTQELLVQMKSNFRAAMSWTCMQSTNRLPEQTFRCKQKDTIQHCQEMPWHSLAHPVVSLPYMLLHFPRTSETVRLPKCRPQ